MCRYLVTGAGGSGMLPPSIECDTEPAAKSTANEYVRNGYSPVRIWELRYKAAEDTRTILTAPNGRAETYEPVNDSTGGNTGGDS